MVAYNEVYGESETNASAINASTSVTFFGTQAARTKRDRYGSANSLIITSDSDENYTVDLDGTDERRIGILSARGSMVIKPEDGLYFDTVRLTNISATNASASEIKIRRARAERVN